MKVEGKEETQDAQGVEEVKAIDTKTDWVVDWDTVNSVDDIKELMKLQNGILSTKTAEFPPELEKVAKYFVEAK